tara:strand:- start:1848 stop:2051 length:204 start_codon:yes stop_codon:yes gene_type:complete
MADPVEEYTCESCYAEFAIELLPQEDDEEEYNVEYCPYCGEQLFLDWDEDDGYRGDDDFDWDDEEGQ